MIAIIDYGMGNLGSVFNMFKKIGAKAAIMSDPDQIRKADKVLLPGVGAFDSAIQRISDLGLKEVLVEKAMVEKVPVLGICLGMQLLTDCSEEGKLPGFGWIKGKTIAFKNHIDPSFKIPHMGWNSIQIRKENELTKGFEDPIQFYFVHSFFVKAENENDSFMKAEYGLSFDAAIAKNNIYGAQFHPEKSHKFGKRLLENFSRI
jgi:glutamine amidotransferase